MSAKIITREMLRVALLKERCLGVKAREQSDSMNIEPFTLTEWMRRTREGRKEETVLYVLNYCLSKNLIEL